MGAWIETGEGKEPLRVKSVAPYVGAWIETEKAVICFVSLRSHPMWVRGLKQNSKKRWSYLHTVAPYVGAWIETIDDFVKASDEQRRTLCGCVD